MFAHRFFSLTWWSVWTSAFFSIAIGLVYMLSGPERFSSPAFVQAQSIMPIQVWGGVYLTFGVAIIAGIAAWTLLARIALYAAGMTYIFYAILFFQSAQAVDNASFGSTVLYLYVTVHCLSAASIVPFLKSKEDPYVTS